jgi:alpha-N-arabinofuranosidase
MTNMAQTVNVLQSLILTQGSKMVLTPTYWAYDLFRPHMGGTAVLAEVGGPTVPDSQGRQVPLLSASASVSPDGRRLFLTLANVDLARPASVEVSLTGALAAGASEGRILTAKDVRAHNTFDEPNRVRPRSREVAAAGDRWTVRIPAASVLAVGLELA